MGRVLLWKQGDRHDTHFVVNPCEKMTSPFADSFLLSLEKADAPKMKGSISEIGSGTRRKRPKLDYSRNVCYYQKQTAARHSLHYNSGLIRR